MIGGDSVLVVHGTVTIRDGAVLPDTEGIVCVNGGASRADPGGFRAATSITSKLHLLSRGLFLVCLFARRQRARCVPGDRNCGSIACFDEEGDKHEIDAQVVVERLCEGLPIRPTQRTIKPGT